MTASLWAVLGVVAHAAGADRKALEHVLDVSGLPSGVALLVAHNKDPADYVTLIREDGRYSLSGWYPDTRHSMSSPRILAFDTRDLGDWMDQVDGVMASFDRKERAWLRQPESARGRQPRLEIELPRRRVDCGEGLRVQRQGPEHWPDVYVEAVHVDAVVLTGSPTTWSCSVTRTPPDLPSRFLGVAWQKLAVVALALAAGLGLLGLSLRRAGRR